MKLIFGLDKLHRVYSTQSREKLLKSALDLGFSGFDVAPIYGNGLAEYEIGLLIRARKLYREKFELNTKWGIPFTCYGPASRYIFPVSRGVYRLLKGSSSEFERRSYTTESLIESVNSSLNRLRCEYIDTLFLHEPSEKPNVNEALELKAALSSLIKCGKIRQFGIAGQNQCIYDWASLLNVSVLQAPLKLFETTSHDMKYSRYGYHISRSLSINEKQNADTYIEKAEVNSLTAALYSTRSTQHLIDFTGKTDGQV